MGAALQAVAECMAPPKDELDVTSAASCMKAVRTYQPDLIIHAAAYTNALKAETEKADCWRVNVTGTENMARAAHGRRFVYISTDYVFDGRLGNYSEADIPNPLNFYGLTKLIGEYVVRQYPNTLILRAPFRADPPWRYERAFDDQFTSCRFVSEQAPEIARAALGDEVGTLHIGGPRRSILEMACEASPGQVGQMFRCEIQNLVLPRDVSLNSTRWECLRVQ